MIKILYTLAIGSLMYTILCMQYDIALAVSITSRYQSNPNKEHWITVKNILKYLRKTQAIFLVFERGVLWVQKFIDSDFMSDVDDRKSMLGYVFLCNGGSLN